MIAAEHDGRLAEGLSFQRGLTVGLQVGLVVGLCTSAMLAMLALLLTGGHC